MLEAIVQFWAFNSIVSYTFSKILGYASRVHGEVLLIGITHLYEGKAGWNPPTESSQSHCSRLPAGIWTAIEQMRFETSLANIMFRQNVSCLAEIRFDSVYSNSEISVLFKESSRLIYFWPNQASFRACWYDVHAVLPGLGQWWHVARSSLRKASKKLESNEWHLSIISAFAFLVCSLQITHLFQLVAMFSRSTVITASPQLSLIQYLPLAFVRKEICFIRHTSLPWKHKTCLHFYVSISMWWLLVCR